MSGRRTLAALGLLLAALPVGAATGSPGPASGPAIGPGPAAAAHATLAAGFRHSISGPAYDPGPDYWRSVGERMASRFAGAVPGTIWIAARLEGRGSELGFPGSSDDPLIQFATTDLNEEALTLFDRAGVQVWLQAEPGFASVEKLIRLMLDRYGHHPCVVGVGVDVEWYRSLDPDHGDAVSDADALAWLAAARAHGPRGDGSPYRLFLKHWLVEKMPPSAREGIFFVDDSQTFPSLEAMIAEFTHWGQALAPSPVGYQFGYESDRPWWKQLADPAREIGSRLVAQVPNLAGLYWVDFTVLAAFPPGSTAPAEPRLQAAPTALAPAAVCADPAAAPALVAPGEPECANDALLAYDALLVIGPHPDDEVLGFGGLEAAYRAAGKPVTVLVTTDGDAYCEACRLWKTSSTTGATCDALDLSNLATPAVDSFGEVRRGESTAAAAALGLPAPTFLGYPDTGLAAAWRNLGAGDPGKPLRRSDFSKCGDCEHCDGGYGEGPETALSAATLEETLRARLAGTSERTLVATTHWLDGHPDHAALGEIVRKLDAELPRPRAVAYAVIHAHTKKETAHPDCWYPGPAAAACPCANEERCATGDTHWVANLAGHRFHPDWPWTPPDDAVYGDWRQLCLAPTLYHGESAAKLAAVRSYASQLGTVARHGSHPPGLSGIMDCNGYLTSFVRKTEPFVLIDGAAATGGP